jgi:hypothetical protein
VTEDWEIIKVITTSEHHFNNLCFKIRTLASTWLLATFAGVGFLLTKQIGEQLEIDHLLVLLCWGGAIGIMVLWILDLLIYQKLLHAWFNAREEIEDRNAGFPQIWKTIKATQPGGRASNRIKLFYISLCSAPLMFAIYVCLYKDLTGILLGLSVTLLICFGFVVWKCTPSNSN